ncbi:hypothetical protein [Bradyrhizobium canariense]|uniref:hypothetical protein n=1 Tax=Bradyrhizobium canariense TaxID=255045 RepID=UPI00117751EF|nr:hypothetical protein [Bradyrhizobium canariense]
MLDKHLNFHVGRDQETLIRVRAGTELSARLVERSREQLRVSLDLLKIEIPKVWPLTGSRLRINFSTSSDEEGTSERSSFSIRPPVCYLAASATASPKAAME